MSAQAQFAAALLEPSASAPDSVTTWNGSDPAQRFGVYRNNVTVSLIDALGAAFPVTRDVVGEAFFAATAREFVRAHPPRSPVMSRYGVAFPAFLRDFPPASCLPYLSDLASLERARIDAFHARDCVALAPSQFAELTPERLPSLRLAPHPAQRIVASPFAIVSIWAAHQRAGESAPDLSGIDPFAPEDALITRPSLDVEVRRLPPGAAATLSRLNAGGALADAAADGYAASPDFDLDIAMTAIVASGAYRSLHVEGDAS
ncbi:MAG: putative DNA-binding domain-containing protein [Rhizobiales bacterium]|nr:putative DNA-binding domain-containing protein [Hyphomicrobiales bacterium]